MKNPYSCESLMNQSIFDIIFHGSIGSLTMGIYSGYITNLMINCYNKKQSN